MASSHISSTVIPPDMKTLMTLVFRSQSVSLNLKLKLSSFPTQQCTHNNTHEPKGAFNGSEFPFERLILEKTGEV